MKKNIVNIAYELESQALENALLANSSSADEAKEIFEKLLTLFEDSEDEHLNTIYEDNQKELEDMKKKLHSTKYCANFEKKLARIKRLETNAYCVCFKTNTPKKIKIKKNTNLFSVFVSDTNTVVDIITDGEIMETKNTYEIKRATRALIKIKRHNYPGNPGYIYYGEL